MQIKQTLIETLPAIIEQQVKPMEQIEGIKILQVDGLVGGVSGGEAAAGNGGGGADQVVNAALRYRAQAPLLDSLMKELGIDGSSLEGLANGALGGAPDAPAE